MTLLSTSDNIRKSQLMTTTSGQARTVKCYNCNGTSQIARNFTQPKRLQNYEYFKDKMLLMQAQENGVALDAEQLLFLAGGPNNAFDDDVDEQPVQDLELNVDNVFQAEDYDAFDSDVDEASTAQTMFMANLSSADPLPMKPDHLMIWIFCLRNASSVPNDTFMMIYDDMCEPIAPSPALYNGHEILKDNHARAKVHNTEDTFEIAENTRKKINAKMTDPECVSHKVKIAPHDYSKENLLTTFTPQKQLTPEQIYWSNDLMKLKSESLKERAKRITPSAITDEERGFEQTKACYLQEVIPFFQTIKDNFEGIQKALTREVKQMKDVFEELEAEVSQCAVDRKHDAVDQKNLLIANDNLIAECLSKENDRFRAENDKVKQHYKQLYDSIKITRDKHIEQVTKLTTENVTLKTSVSKAKVHPSVLTRTKHAVDVELIVPRLRNNRDAHLDYLRHLKESVETIRDIVEEAKVLAYTPLIRKKEDIVTKPSNRQDSNKNKHVVTQKIQKTNVPVPHSTGVKRYPKAGGSQPKRNHKTNRISPAKGDNKLPVKDLPRMNKSHLRTTNRVDSNSCL
nr:hypothetical protein [Tanacetum cinerariifolium]